MSDQLIAAAEARVERGALRQAAVIVAIFAIAGVLCGLLWEALWTPAQGGVIKHVWYPVSWYAWQDTFFAASAWYIVVGAVAGLLLGALAAWRFDRAEMVSLAAVVVGGLVAALLMRLVGMHRGPGDPQAAAKTAADGVTLPSEFTAPSWWLLLVFPGSALASLGLYFMTVAKRGASGPENTTAQPPPAE
ncbi:hypothetical protein [Nocardioides nematodiphilus]|uniref:hypothetical protein n=1 Tax=Nocardioides nematodiphilus TaxID=2849669 RepID=UPI001CDA2181|nr:hypothetical protein [Nocardioides nematodiphilus]MCA1982505.1 hypothetical protein [Nocardioides nematodiphilus]